MDNELKVLIFTIDDEYFATDIMEVERIIGYEPTTKLPDSPEFIEGVINNSDNILPVMNLAKRFKLNSIKNTKDAKIVVAKEEKGKIGIVVDAVSEVKNIKESDVESAPEVVSGISKRYIRGLIKLEDKIVIFLNLVSILTEEEKEKLL